MGKGIHEYIAADQLPSVLGGSFEGGNAWQTVLNTSTNASQLIAEWDAADNEDEDDDTQWMKEKTLEFEKGSGNKKNGRMSKIFEKGKSKISSAKTKIIESKDKIKQKRENKKNKMNEEANDSPTESKKAARILSFNKRKEPSVPQNEENNDAQIEKADDNPKEKEVVADDEKIENVEKVKDTEDNQDAQ